MRNVQNSLGRSIFKILILFGLMVGFVASNHMIPSAFAVSGPEALTKPKVSEKNLHDTLLTLLTPAIDQAVKTLYGEPKQYDLFNAKIDSIERPESGGFHFIVTVTIQTFEGAHSPPYGKDRLTFDVTPEQTTLLDTKHNDVEARL